MTPEKAAIRRATLQAQRALARLDAAGAKELERAYRDAAAGLRETIAAHAGADETVGLEELRRLLDQVEARLAALSRLRNEILDEGLDKAARYGAMAIEGAEMAAAVASPAAMQVSEEALRFVHSFVGADGLQLSDRIWRLDRGARDAVVNAIERAVIEGYGAAQAARAFLARGEAVPADLAAKMRGPTAGRLGKDAAEALTGTGGAMDNAMRVFRTEINRAHGEAYMRGGEGKPYFGGWRFLLSPAHPKPDICDLLAAQNLYGLGNGVYPSREKCPWPAHPNTLSFVEIVFKDEITEADREGKETPMAALGRLDPEVRRGVLGKGKAEAFDDGRLTQGMIRVPAKAVRERLEQQRAATKAGVAADARDALSKQYFNGRDIAVSGSFRELATPSGVIDRESVPLLLGAPDGAKIHVKDRRTRIEMEAIHPLFASPREMYVDRNGILHWDGFFLRDDAPEGLGTRMAAMTITTARALGIPEIQMTAWGKPHFNGSYTWGRLGFDAAFGAADKAKLVRAGFAGVKSVQELLATAGGQAWWKANGWRMEMRFDLDPGSASMEVFQRYLAEKGVRL